MSRRVIIVDDSLVQRQKLAGLVAQIGGFEVVGTAGTGAEGIKLYEQLRPDLVLLDVVMPVLDGLSCLRAIKSFDARVKVVLISAIGAVTRTIGEAKKLGADEIITKPYDPQAVRAVLEKMFA